MTVSPSIRTIPFCDITEDILLEVLKKREIKKKRLSTSTGGVKVLEEFCTELKSYIVVLVIKHLLHVAVNCCPLVGETKGDAKGLQGKNFPALSLQPGQQFPRSSALPQKPCDK